MNISRGSLHDGKGVRTVVYLKGCNMRCKWCHNPESISAKKQLMITGFKCIHCGICIDTCPAHHILNDSEHQYIKDGCTACGKCAENCPVNAIQVCGEEKTPQEVLSEILKDKHYYDTSSGGVTFSGGECLLYPAFMCEITQLCREQGISVIVESALNVPWKNIEAVLPYVESFFVDIKHMDSNIHRIYTGCDNGRILENIRLLAKKHPNICIRVPLIPGVNDGIENLKQTVQFAKSCGESIQHIELLKYNTLGESKYRLLQESYEAFAKEPQSDDYMKELCKELNVFLGEENFVFFI